MMYLVNTFFFLMDRRVKLISTLKEFDVKWAHSMPI